jgi:hypothetical protein
MPLLAGGKQIENNVTELTAIAPLVPGTAKQLRLVLAGVQRRPTSPIERIQTIHYARWVIIDDDTRLLFTSNFDGGLDDYLEEFAERDEVPLNQIFGFCVGWPGAKPSGPFIKYVRDHMIEAAYYYAAYPKYTVKEVKRALHWKQETERFLQELAQRRAEMPNERRAAIRDFMERLAQPSPLRS